MKIRILAADEKSTPKIKWSYYHKIQDSCNLVLSNGEARTLTEAEVESINEILENVVSEITKVDAHFKEAQERFKKKEQGTSTKKEEPKKEEPKK